MSEIPFKGEIRRDYFTGSDILFTFSRDTRPKDFRNDETTYASADACPFEYGKESLNTTLKLVGDPWKLRLMYNKYPVVNEDVKSFTQKGFFTKYANHGSSYIIIDTPKHDMKFQEIDDDILYRWLHLVIEAEQTAYKDKKTKHVYVFKNSGNISGGSLHHQHTQIIGFPFELPIIRQELGIIKYNGGKCIFEEAVEKENERTLMKDKNSVAFSPFGSRFRGMSVIGTKRHINNIMKLKDEEIRSIVVMLKEILRRNEIIFGKHSYNVMFHETKNEKEFHFYMEVAPRFSNAGAMELSGLYMNSLRPEIYVEKFRDAA